MMLTVNITQRQATLGVLGIAMLGSWLTLALALINGNAGLLVFLIGSIGLTLLFAVYWQTDWRYTAPILLVGLTALIALGLPEPYVSEQLTLAILTPPLLALVLGNVAWIVGVGLITILTLIARAGGTGPLGSDPIMLVIALTAVGLIALGRMVMDTERRRAEAAMISAEESAARAEESAEELQILARD
jgi:hypothetical protein